jgi:hypothetical protein
MHQECGMICLGFDRRGVLLARAWLMTQLLAEFRVFQHDKLAANLKEVAPALHRRRLER